MAGYKAEQFVDRIDANLVCPICHDVLRDPMQCREGHSFCRYCIERWLKVIQKCPMDNCFIRDDSLSCNLALRGVIHNMKVSCHPKDSEENWETTATSQGSKDTTLKCSWIGTLQDLPTHQKTCPFQLVHCSHINCIVKLQRKQIKEHEDSCKYKTITCDNQCGLVLVRFELENHKKNGCPETEIPCPNECTDVEGIVQKVKRMDLDDHFATACGKELVDCPYKDRGCSIQVERQHVEKHVQENIAEHMKLIEMQNTQLKSELSEVKRISRYGSFSSYLWKVFDYQSLAKTKHKGTSFSSPTFHQCGHRWMLEVYPNGSNISCLGMVIVRLYWIADEDGKQYENRRLSAVVSLKVLSTKPGSSNHCVTKNVTFIKTNDYWEFDRFMKADRALSTSFCDSSNGMLQIECTIQRNDT